MKNIIIITLIIIISCIISSNVRADDVNDSCIESTDITIISTDIIGNNNNVSVIMSPNVRVDIVNNIIDSFNPNIDMEFNHYTGEWVEVIDNTVINCILYNLNSANNDTSLAILITLCKGKTL